MFSSLKYTIKTTAKDIICCDITIYYLSPVVNMQISGTTWCQFCELAPSIGQPPNHQKTGMVLKIRIIELHEVLKMEHSLIVTSTYGTYMGFNISRG